MSAANAAAAAAHAAAAQAAAASVALPMVSVAPVTSLQMALPGQLAAVAPHMTLPFSMAAALPGSFGTPVMSTASHMMLARPAMPAMLPVAQPQMMMAPMMTMRPQFANQGKSSWQYYRPR